MYGFFDMLGLRLERANLQQNRFLKLIPPLKGRRGGTHTLTEWAYTIGLFQSVIHGAVGQRDRIEVLDVGCGSGRLSLAVAPLLGREGRYVGVDVSHTDLAWCERMHANDPRFSFVHLNHKNRSYASGQGSNFPPYPLPNNSFDVATAVSVWTHLNEADSTFYFQEVGRVLKPGGKAIITFFYLDEAYQEFRKAIPRESAFSLRKPERYAFETPVDGSTDWFCPQWAGTPESAIGITVAGIERMASAAGLELSEVHPGFWKEKPGLFFQDVLVFTKPLSDERAVADAFSKSNWASNPPPQSDTRQSQVH